MGCSCSKNAASGVIKGNKISSTRVIDYKLTNNNSKDKEVGKGIVEFNPKRNYYYAINREFWEIIIDFLSFKELLKVGRLNQ